MLRKFGAPFVEEDGAHVSKRKRHADACRASEWAPDGRASVAAWRPLLPSPLRWKPQSGAVAGANGTTAPKVDAQPPCAAVHAPSSSWGAAGVSATS